MYKLVNFILHIILHSAMLYILCIKCLNCQMSMQNCIERVIYVVYLFDVVSYVITFPTQFDFILNFIRILFKAEQSG